ncbi:hypothetical protein [Streptomyces sp. NPDC008125]|uniref:hypothetical protein n=1 Tax=Streptomyces sp. NPDC008125 TaxID=3364811 RepID=UPI0036E6974D
MKALWGPLTEGLTLPEVLRLDDRETALGPARRPPLGERPTGLAAEGEALGSDREAGFLVGAWAWPLLACRMARIARTAEGEPGLGPDGEHVLRACLRTLADHPAWKEGPVSGLTGRLVAATLSALTTPPGTPATGPRVSPAAARLCSTTTTAPPAGRAPAVPVDAVVPAHRQ